MLLPVSPCGGVAHPQSISYGVQKLEYSCSFKQTNKQILVVILKHTYPTHPVPPLTTPSHNTGVTDHDGKFHLKKHIILDFFTHRDCEAS